MNNIQYYERFKSETIYLWNDNDQVYIKSDPKEGYFAKYPGKEEFKIAADSKPVVLAIDAKKEVTKKEYESA